MLASPLSITGSSREARAKNREIRDQERKTLDGFRPFLVIKLRTILDKIDIVY
jgi:hypothetical protein